MRNVVVAVAMLIAIAGFAHPGWADMEYVISCEGSLSNGNGSWGYEYTLKNTGGTTDTLRLFCLGTQDPNPANYSFMATAGFTVSIVPNDGFPPCDVLYTTGVKTPHQQAPPMASTISGAVIWWSGKAAVPPGGTITFAFYNKYAPLDQEWHANSDAGWTIAQPTPTPMAGPSGVYTNGYVHGPGTSLAMPFQMSCEGARSNGGGTYNYQYTLKNITDDPATLTDLCVGTQDPVVGNYTFQPTAGFTASIVANDAFPPCDVLYTSHKKTQHGQVPPMVGSTPSGAVIYWQGSTVVPSGGTVTFAFSHPNYPHDHEWHANSDVGWSIGQADDPMAGPVGIFTYGYVHAPSELDARIPTLNQWGMIALVVLLLAAATWVLVLRRRRSMGEA